MSRYLKLSLAYDGTEFVGWQAQAAGRTVQQTLELAWKTTTGESRRITASGRTDSGVHAIAQVASVETESQLDTATLKRALNANTPLDICIHDVAEMPFDFHAIRDAIGKLYRYQLQYGRLPSPFNTNYAWYVPRQLDIPKMETAAELLRGTHDFSSFEATGSPRSDSIRTITELSIHSPNAGVDRATQVTEQGRGVAQFPVIFPTIYIDVAADGFLYNMVRNIVGSLVEVGSGKQSPQWIAEVLAAKDRRVAGMTAPPQGLFLMRVDYPNSVQHELPTDRLGSH